MVDAKKIEELRGLCERLEKRAAFWERYWTGRSLQDPDSGPIREAAALIRSLSLRVEAEKRAREEALAENARLARLVYVPGQWRCAKCKFTLIQANLNANDGTVTARDQPGDKCPNCDSSLWRVTERDAGNEMIDRAEEAFEAKRAAETHSAALARALEEATSRAYAALVTARAYVREDMCFEVDENDCAQTPEFTLQEINAALQVIDRARSLLAPKEDTANG